MDAKKKIDSLVRWIKKTAPPKHGLLVPISGGSDSALTLWLCNKALPQKTLGVFAGSRIRAEKWFESVGKIRKIAPPDKERNIEVMRWAKFLELNLKEKRVLVGTRNKSEECLGTFSLASRVAAFFPIIGLWKSEVIELCEYIGVPEEVIASSRRADPACGRPQELADIPIPLLDAFLRAKAGEKRNSPYLLSRAQRAYLEKLYAQNSWKRELPTKGPGSVIER